MGEKDAGTLPEGSVVAGRYEILRCIGIGGFGTIYLCEDRVLHRRVAVKEYFPRQWAEREDVYVSVKRSSMAEAFRYGMLSFLQEAKIMEKFGKTPHVVTFYDALEANDTVYLVMEYIDGISAGRSLRERGYRPYTPREAAEILLPALEGLGAMHKEKIIHRDISPGNIMCPKEGPVTLIDLGAAKDYTEKTLVPGAAFLKPDFAAPEQYRTAKDGIALDEGPWTDIYAAGGTLYCLLTGRRPPDVISRVKDGDRSDVKLPKKWRRLIRQATALKIRDRIDSAEEFSRRIRSCL